MKGVRNIKNTKNFRMLITVSATIYMLIGNYGEIKNEIIQTSFMWCTVLVPSLFPYLVLSQYITSSELLTAISHFIKAPAEKLFRINTAGIRVFLCSLVCGYPSGAICTADLYRKAHMTTGEAERIICFTNNAGPLFLISAIGTGMLGSTSDGVALYSIQLFSSVCYAFVSGILSDKYSYQQKNNAGALPKKDFCECVRSSVGTIINIGGFVITISVICRIILLTIHQLFPDFYASRYLAIETFVYVLFEISKASELIAPYADSSLFFSFLCASVSWGGICVFLQVSSALPEEIKIRRFIKAKFIQSLISFTAGYIYKSFFSAKNIIYVSHNLLFISLIFTAGIFVLYVIKNKKRLLP